MSIEPDLLQRRIREALDEDIRTGDVTSESTVPPDARGAGTVTTREEGTICGGPVAEMVFTSLDPSAEVDLPFRDGERIRKGDRILTVRGNARSLLSAERVALNFLQRLSGIATATRSYVDAIRGTRAAILDTRKTTPLWREMEKYAVLSGGGRNHRMGLHDQALIKENHLAFLPAPDALAKAIATAREKVTTVIVEATTRDEAIHAAGAGADVVLLDNFTRDDLAGTIPAIRSLELTSVLIEVSGGVTLANVREIALLGPDRISVGALTHSVRALNFSMEIIPDSP